MHMKNVFLLCVFAFGWCTLEATAQQDSSEANPRAAQIHAIARATADSVVLRWAPTKPGAWIVANGIGYVVERRRITENDDPRLFNRLTTTPLVPWTLDEWKQRSKPEQKFAAIAAQCLYGKQAVPPATASPVQQLRFAADELMNRYSFSLFAADNDAHAANGLALRFVDRDVRQGEQYAYRILLARQDSTYAIDTAYVVVDIEPAPTIIPPPNLTAEELDSLIILRWNNAPGNGFSGFYVERSDDNGATYKRVNAIPIVPITPDNALQEMTPRFTDSTIVNYRAYRYRVRGITPFAELSEPAEIQAMGRDLTPPPTPRMKKPLLPSGNTVVLQWDMEGDMSDLAGFVVARSAYPDQDFAQMFTTPLPAASRSFLDTSATLQQPYYMVGAVDTAGNVAASLVVYADIIDTLPPAVPTGITAAIDTNGVVTLRWNLGAERDLLGYRVLWANDSTHEFSQRTPEPLQDTVFTDTVNIRTLTSHVYYKVVAVDTRYLHSEASPIVALQRPDIVPPEPSVFTNVFVTDSSVVLSWEPSRSTDVQWQRIERRASGAAQWSDLARLPAQTRRYADTAVKQRVQYDYRITAIDSAGHHSEQAFSVTGRPYDTGRRPGIDNLKATLASDRRSIALSWTYPATNEKHWFVVYRSFNGSAMRQYKAIQNATPSFDDTLLVGEGTYQYAVRVMMDNGAESDISQSVEIRIPR